MAKAVRSGDVSWWDITQRQGSDKSSLSPGHDRSDKPGSALGHDRDGKNGRALGHLEQGEDQGRDNTEDSGAIEIPCDDEPILFIGTELDETIDGACGNDELYGGQGDDIIAGHDGNDYLSGNWGQDVLIGGLGADTFSFDGDFDSDTVTDFSVVQGDRLNFIFYEKDSNAWTSEMLADLFVQQGSDAVLKLSGTDQSVTLLNIDVAMLEADMISVTNIMTEDLLAI